MEPKPKLVTVVLPAIQNLQHTLTDTPSPNTVTDTPVMNTQSPIIVMDTSPSHLTIPAFTITNPIRPKQWAFSIYSTKILHSKMPTWDTISANLQNPLFELYFYYGSDNFYVSEWWIKTFEKLKLTFAVCSREKSLYHLLKFWNVLPSYECFKTDVISNGIVFKHLEK